MFRLVEGGKKLPQRATRYSAGFDVFAREDTWIGAGETETIGLGIALDLSTELTGGWANSFCMDNGAFNPEDQEVLLDYFMGTHYFKLCLRSSLGAKGLILPNGHGVIDMDYRDEIKMGIHNPMSRYTAREYAVYRGDKIGQLILCRHEGNFLPAEYTLDVERTGGFGSTS